MDRNPKSGHDRISQRRLAELRPSPENDQLYRPVVPTDPEIIALAKSIRDRGVIEPLVITEDGFLLSGHRRYAAARLARLTEVPCRVEPIRREDDIDAFVVLLREFNRQRHKTIAERVREELVAVQPAVAHAALVAARAESAKVDVAMLELGKRRQGRRGDARARQASGALRNLRGQATFSGSSETRDRGQS